MKHLQYRKTNDRPDGLSYRHHHTLFEGENKQRVVLQDSTLYTANGKRIPQDLPAGADLDKFAIPPELRFLVDGGTAPPEAAIHFPDQPKQNFVAGLQDFSTDELRAAVEILRQARSGNRSLSPAPLVESSVSFSDDLLAGVSLQREEASLPPQSMFGGALFNMNPAPPSAQRVSIGKR